MSTTYLIVLAIALFNTGCAPLFECEDSKVGELISTDGKFKLLVFDRDCGATTSVSTHVVVCPSGQKEENIESDRLIVYRGGRIAVKWSNEKRLDVMLDPGGEVFLKREALRGVVVQYITNQVSGMTIFRE